MPSEHNPSVLSKFKKLTIKQRLQWTTMYSDDTMLYICHA
jgi:hypothetical protein